MAGTTKLACDGQGLIAVKDIMDKVNENIDDIFKIQSGSGQINGDIGKLTQQVIGNTTRVEKLENATPPPSRADIGLLSNRLDVVEKKQGEHSTDITNIKSQVLTNKNDIAGMTGNVTQALTEAKAATADVARLDQDVTNLNSTVGTLQVSVADNTSQIFTVDQRALANAALITDLKKDILKNALDIKNISGFIAIFEDSKPAGQTGGTAAVNTWTERPVGSPIVDDIHITSIGNKIELPAGEYIIDGYATATGENQSRLVIGTNEIYGTVSESSGHSLFSAYVTLTASTQLAIQTIVSTSNGADSLGKASPFGHDKVFSKIHIRKAK